MPDPGEFRVRRRTPKVRTGCLQCKRGRVKCPEQRPACARCMRLGLDCEYLPAKQCSGGLRRIFPLRVKESSVGAVQPQLSSSPLADLEKPYFEHFRVVMAHDLAAQPYGVGEFWHRTVLREAMVDQGVRDTIVAIGALSRASKTTCRGQNPTHSSDQFPHYSLALKYYGRALSRYQNLVTQQVSGAGIPRKILIGTLLITAFETLQGNTAGSDALTAQGLLVLKDQIMKRNPSGTGSQLALTMDDQGVEEAEFYLARYSATSSLMTPLYLRTRDSVIHLPDLLHDSWAPPEPGQNFRALQSQYMRSVTTIIMWLNRRLIRMAAGESYETDLQVQEEQAIVLARIERWQESIEKHLKAAKPPSLDFPGDGQDWMALYLADFGLKCCYISTISIRDPTRRLLTSNKYFRDILRRAKVILKYKASPAWHRNGMDERLVFCLANITRECREVRLRAEALELAMGLADSRLSWDAKAALLGYRVLAAWEAKFADDRGFIPVEKHYTWSAAGWNEGRTVLYVTLTARVPSEDAQPQKFALRLADYGLA